MPRANPIALFVLLVAALGAGGDALGHHAGNLYNDKQPRTVNGEVLRLAFRPPHVELYVLDGKGERWTVSMTSPEEAKRSGQRRDMMGLLPGVTVQVVGWPHRLKTRELRLQELIFSDGTVLAGYQQPEEEPAPQQTLRRLLNNTRWLAVQEVGPVPRAGTDLKSWVAAARPLERLALELHTRRAFFIGLPGPGGARYPGISAHLACLPERLPERVFSDLPDDAGTLGFVERYNGALARYLEGQLETCGD